MVVNFLKFPLYSWAEYFNFTLGDNLFVNILGPSSVRLFKRDKGSVGRGATDAEDQRKALVARGRI